MFKRHRFLFCVLILFSAIFQAMGESHRDFVHATYFIADKISRERDLEQADFTKFDFYYIIAGPKWGADDFEDLDQSMKKFVTDHAYPAARRGEGLTPELIRKIHEAKAKALVSLPSVLARGDFPNMAGTPEKRRIFAAVLTEFCKKYDFDGIEIDWENTLVIPHYIELIKELRRALNRLDTGKKYYLTTALHTHWKFTPEQVRELSDNLDWINIMTYDLGHGNWGNKAKHNTPLDFIKLSLNQNWDRFDPSKICVGLASYGFHYTDVVPEKVYPETLNRRGRYFQYTELDGLLKKGWTEQWDAPHGVPYYFSPDGKDFVSIDNLRSLRMKVDFILAKKYRGVFWWEFHYDYLPPAEGARYGRHLLAEPVDAMMRENR